MIAIVAPGQGAQRPGLLEPWLALRGVREQLAELSAAADVDLLAAGTIWDAPAIAATEVAQPLVVAAALISARLLAEQGIEADVVAGHSVGEWAAAVLAGVLSADEAMRLVAERGRAMASACAASPTGMAAILGGDRQAVLDRLGELDLSVANDNGNGQLVAGGTRDALDELAAVPPVGARVRRLEVAGAFHTAAMRPARAALSDAVANATPGPAKIPFLSNRDGALIDSVQADGAITAGGGIVLERLVAQVAAPVRWDLCTQTLAAIGVTKLIELAPAGTLAGLAKRALPGVEIVALKASDFGTTASARPSLLLAAAL